jgi:hypothetical protein
MWKKWDGKFYLCNIWFLQAYARTISVRIFIFEAIFQWYLQIYMDNFKGKIFKPKKFIIKLKNILGINFLNFKKWWNFSLFFQFDKVIEHSNILPLLHYSKSKWNIWVKSDQTTFDCYRFLRRRACLSVKPNVIPKLLPFAISYTFSLWTSSFFLRTSNIESSFSA